ncbi:hypothetical protein [Rhizobium lusitanum]|uniref:hypothetical protein n=1 Tax=Rhizobium lusitanum TaxID=293958 RepID=UPI001959AA9F|nr:hypothetical protein [Rhizobium lusitanum]MBM7044107.1 hypothetical protein [Rhizobium lusitanum]
MIWSHDLTAAPLGTQVSVTRTVKGVEKQIIEHHVAPVWLATADGKVHRSYWIPETKTSEGRWAGFTVGSNEPIAWQLYVVPTHPNHQSDSGVAAAFGAAGPSPEKACAPLSDHEYVERIGDRVIAERKIADAAADLVAHLGINDCGGGV